MQTLNEKAISIGQQLIGRDAHVAELLAEFKRAAAGHGSMALIRGDGGIGKSRLANEVLARVAPMGAVVMIGHAASADRGTPYALVRDLLGNVPRDAPADVVDRTRRLADLIEIGDPQDRSGARPHALLSAVVELIERITDRDPLVMVWEDLHAADADSLSLFMRLARQLSARRALLIGSMRERSGAETAELDRLVEQLELDGRGIVVDVGPLDRSDVHALVAQVIGVSPDQSIVDLVFESSRGNPFFATETARSLVASSSVALDGGKARLLEHQPVLRPRTALVHRFFQVGSNDAHVARIISAFGRVSVRQLALVASIAKLPEGDTTGCFDRLVAEQLLVRVGDDRFEFAHSILREALYDDVGPGEQRRLHQLIADSLRRERDRGVAVDVTDLARHVSLSADPGDEAAAAILAEAGRATARTAPLVSARWFERCAQLLPVDSPTRTTITASQAAAMFRASRPRAAARLGRAALEHLPAGAARSRTLAETVNSLYICGELRLAGEVLDDEERRAGGLDGPLLAQRAHFRTELGERFDAEPDHAATHPGATAAETANMMTHDLHRAGLCGDGVTVDKLFDDLERLGPATSRQTQISTLGAIATEAAFLTDVERAQRVLAAAAALRVNDRSVSFGAQIETAEVLLGFQLGQWDDVMARVPDLAWELEHTETIELNGIIQHVVCEIHLERGETKQAAEVAAGFRWHIEAVRQRVCATIGKVALAQGDITGARTVLTAALDDIDASGLRYGLDILLESLIDACLAAGDRDAAEARLDQLESEARRWPRPLCVIRAQLAAARVRGDADAARAAAQSAASLGLTFHHAQALLLLGTLGDDASRDLTTAHQIFDQLGALPWRQRAAAELRARRATVPRRSADDAGLTDTEAALAKLVSAGMSNRDIAATMHYSVKTVEVYLTRLYAKTGCRSRIELARAVDRGDIPLPHP